MVLHHAKKMLMVTVYLHATQKLRTVLLLPRRTMMLLPFRMMVPLELRALVAMMNGRIGSGALITPTQTMIIGNAW
jgi:hypothetical protein